VGWKHWAFGSFGLVLFWVEREPMWDGNSFITNGKTIIPVEREPTWDGNP